MKKTGFTLAEVLITLTIIGVVATMTLPALMTNTQEQQAKTGLKKGVNTLTEAAQTNQAISTFDYGSQLVASNAVNAANIEDDQSITGILVNRTNIDYTSTLDATLQSKVDATANNYVVFFKDGSAVSYPKGATPATNYTTLQPDGLPLGFGVVYDYNGARKPNILSNCSGNTALKANSTAINDSNATCTKATRVIKDQFGIKLRGAYAYPNGAAARWAYDN